MTSRGRSNAKITKESVLAALRAANGRGLRNVEIRRAIFGAGREESDQNDLGAEHLRFKPDGTILVHGRVATKDADVADAVRGWAGALPNSPLKIAARMLDRLSFRTTVWGSPLWASTKHGPCGIVGDMSDVMDARLMAIRIQTEFFSHPDDRRAAFEARGLEVDTACAKWNRAGVCDYTRASLEVEHGRDWRSASWPACVKCGAKHPGAVA